MMKADDDSVSVSDRQNKKPMKAAVELDGQDDQYNRQLKRRNQKADAERKAAAAASENDGAGETKLSFADKCKVSFQNCMASTGLCCFKFKEQSQITALEYKITNRQKQFGVEYLTLVQDKAPADQLKSCLKKALQDISTLQEQMNQHYDNIEDQTDKVHTKKLENAYGVQSNTTNTNTNATNTGEGTKETKSKKPKKSSNSNNSSEHGSVGAAASGGESNNSMNADDAPAAAAAAKKKKKKKKPPASAAEDDTKNFSIDDE